MSDPTSQGAGGEFGAYIALPDTTPAPGIVVAQEIFGVNQVMRDICDWLAGQGYVAACPDLFWRIEPGIQLTDKTEAEWARAFELFNLFDVDKGIEDMKKTLTQLRGHEACNGRAGTIGYCLGGKIAYLMATRSDADCNVSYYGVGLDELLGEAWQIRKPLLLHMASKDQFVPPEQQEQVASRANREEAAQCTRTGSPSCSSNRSATSDTASAVLAAAKTKRGSSSAD